MKKALKDFKQGECFRFMKNGSVYFVKRQIPEVYKTQVALVNTGEVFPRSSDLLVYPVDVNTLY
jgi:hypothetical protein